MCNRSPKLKKMYNQVKMWSKKLTKWSNFTTKMLHHFPLAQSISGPSRSQILWSDLQIGTNPKRKDSLQFGSSPTQVQSNAHLQIFHYPICLLDIQQDSCFSTGCGYPKTTFKQEPETDKDIRSETFHRYFEDSGCKINLVTFDHLEKLHIAQSFIILESIISTFCAIYARDVTGSYSCEPDRSVRPIPIATKQ